MAKKVRTAKGVELMKAESRYQDEMDYLDALKKEYNRTPDQGLLSEIWAVKKTIPTLYRAVLDGRTQLADSRRKLKNIRYSLFAIGTL